MRLLITPIRSSIAIVRIVARRRAVRDDRLARGCDSALDDSITVVGRRSENGRSLLGVDTGVTAVLRSKAIAWNLGRPPCGWLRTLYRLRTQADSHRERQDSLRPA
jgi:hypothetical protein